MNGLGWMLFSCMRLGFAFSSACFGSTVAETPARFTETRLSPQLHYTTDCMSGTFHPMAAGFTFKGVHHTWTIADNNPKHCGWSHAVSHDLVHWHDIGIDVVPINESYEGMHSFGLPQDGFVVEDDDGVPCAGFRQNSGCGGRGSTSGTTGLNPNAHKWDVPLEIRCANNQNLTRFNPPQFLQPVYYYRDLPYDPVRPWKDFDGKWYSAISTDGCNSTTKRLPCKAGGSLALWTAPKLTGPWTQLPALFTTSVFKSGNESKACIEAEFVDSQFMGGLVGDPDGGTTRLITQKHRGSSFWVGRQANGSTFEAFWDRIGAVGMYDYGVMGSVAVLGEPKVTVVGRTLIAGSIVGPRAYQALVREMSLSTNYELLQQFAPELKILRKPGTSRWLTSGGRAVDKGSMQLEAIANFKLDTARLPTEPFGVEVLRATDGNTSAKILIDCSAEVATRGCIVGVDARSLGGHYYSGPLLPVPSFGQVTTVYVHAYVDNQIIEVIFNNRTAMALFCKPRDDEAGVKLFGEPYGQLETWELAAALSRKGANHGGRGWDGSVFV